MTEETIPWSDEVAAADWLVDQLSDDLGSVAWLVPRSFPAVAQLIHSDSDALGTLPLDDAAALIGVLRPFTTTPGRCWFGVSEEFGWNGLDPVGGPVFRSDADMAGPDADAPADGLEGTTIYRRRYDKPVVRAPLRSFMLYSGPIEAAWMLVEQFDWNHLPNLWWPDDRSWCVRTDIEFDSTYIAGSSELIDALLGESRLRVLRSIADGRNVPRSAGRGT